MPSHKPNEKHKSNPDPNDTIEEEYAEDFEDSPKKPVLPAKIPPKKPEKTLDSLK